MSTNQKLVTTGTVGGTPVNADISRIEPAVAVKVHLTANYTIAAAPGFPARPGLTGASQANLDYPRVIPSGTTIALLAHEAAALVAASAATYA